MTKNLKKFTAENFYIFVLIKKIAIYLSLEAQTTEKPSALKREHTALQNMKILYFFLFLWVIFALPDPATQN
jgi:hypothetical protein